MSPQGQGDLKWGRSLKEETQRERGQGPREGRGVGKEETGSEGSLEEKAISSPCPGGDNRHSQPAWVGDGTMRMGTHQTEVILCSGPDSCRRQHQQEGRGKYRHPKDSPQSQHSRSPGFAQRHYTGSLFSHLSLAAVTTLAPRTRTRVGVDQLTPAL